MFAPRNSSPPLSYFTNNDDMAAHQVIEHKISGLITNVNSCVTFFGCLEIRFVRRHSKSSDDVIEKCSRLFAR